MRAIGLTKPRGAVKAKSSLSARGTIRKAQSRDFQSTSHCWSTQSINVGTRKMVNYAWPG